MRKPSYAKVIEQSVGCYIDQKDFQRFLGNQKEICWHSNVRHIQRIGALEKGCLSIAAGLLDDRFQ